MLHRKSDFQLAALFLLLCILLGKPSVETTPFPPLVIVKLWIQYLSSFNHIYTIGIKTYHSLRMSNMASCSKNPFDKSSAKCTRDKCYRWDIWGSPNAFDSRSSLQIGHSHPFADSAIALFHTAPSFFLCLFYPLCRGGGGETNRETFWLFSPSDVWHFVRHCVKLSLEQSGRNHLFCNFRAKFCPQEFPLPLKRPSCPS